MNNLDSLLQTAREVNNAQPLVERDELISIAGRYTSDAPSTTHAAQASSITSIKTIMNIIASLLVVGAAAWYGLSNHDQQSQQLQTPTPSTAPISTSSQNTGVANTADEFSKGDNKSPSTQRDVNSTFSNIIRVIELSPAELAKLGIIQSDSTIECSYEREMKVYQDAARLVAKFERLGYDTDRENEVVQARMIFTADSTHIDFVANTNSDRTKSSPLCPAEGFYCTPNKSQMSFTPTGYSPRLEFHARDKAQNEFFQLLSLMGLGDP